jgi:tetratricopeptide (TPR) repeat protein
MATRLDLADGLIARSIEHLRRNEPAQAEEAARQALAADPDNLDRLRSLAYALHVQARHRESEGAYLKLATLEPSQPLHWMNVGTARRCDDRIDEALFAFARAAALGANTADFYYNVALAHIGRDDYEAARSLLQKARALAPDDAEVRYRYAYCCYETLRTDEALAALDGWEALAAAPDIAASAGHLMMKLGDIERAEPTVREAASQGDSDPRAMLTFIQLLERTNRIAEARALFERLRADPAAASLGNEFIMTEGQLAQRESKHEAAAALFRGLAAECRQPHLTHFQQFPLARSLDALGRYEEAFGAASEAHASQLAYIKLTASPALYAGPPLAITDHGCEAQDIARWTDDCAPSAAQSPVFIVGFPRSGTTLLELTLDAHPLLESIDEQPFLQHALDDMLAEQVRYPVELATLTQPQLDRIRSAYWDKAARRVERAPGQRLIDKNPLNVFRLPVIKRLFPNAKVIFAIRHPCDVILSCFMQHFRAPDFAILCKDIGTLAAAYRRTFDFWHAQQELLRADVLELRYERLVDAFEPEARRVFDFLELPWDPAVLSPATRAQEKRFISTPSYAQVVQPINDRAIDRWRNYQEHFTASLPVLMPYLVRWSYSS